jgi:hypothetical protein
MNEASESILQLKPVSFQYKHELDSDGIPQFGLVAEEIEKVNPELVAPDEKGKAYTVRYEAVNAMLLNEFLKEHRKVEAQSRKDVEQQASIARLESTVAQQQDQIKVLAASLKEQALQIQKVNAQLSLQKPGARWRTHGTNRFGFPRCRSRRVLPDERSKSSRTMGGESRLRVDS